MNSLRSATYLALLITIFLSLLQLASASPLCPATNREDEDVSKCKYGTAIGWCGKLECAKGPSERCGGNWLEHGVCGKGMYCGCGYCAGCYMFNCVSRMFC